MNWYTRIADKSIRDIAWDPNPKDTQDNWDNAMKESDLNALMLRLYQMEVDPDLIDEEDVDDAFLQLKDQDLNFALLQKNKYH